MFVSEVELAGNSMVECRLCEKFDLIYSTSIGATIAALLGLGKTVDEVAARKSEMSAAPSPICATGAN